MGVTWLNKSDRLVKVNHLGGLHSTFYNAVQYVLNREFWLGESLLFASFLFMDFVTLFKGGSTRDYPVGGLGAELRRCDVTD